MNVLEVEGIARYVKNNFPKFYLEPAAIAKRWHGIIGDFTRDEALDAVDYLGKNTDFLPTERSIRDRCQLVRKQAQQREYNREQSHLYNEAELSFRDVPGNTRFEKILYVCAEQAARSWQRDQDNEFYGDLLLKAKAAGFEFDGIDYDQIRPTGDADGFLTMARGHQ